MGHESVGTTLPIYTAGFAACVIHDFRDPTVSLSCNRNDDLQQHLHVWCDSNVLDSVGEVKVGLGLVSDFETFLLGLNRLGIFDQDWLRLRQRCNVRS